MPFIATVTDAEASDAVAEIFDADQARVGYVPNYTRLFAHRPAVYGAWRHLLGAVTEHMDPRRYELATIAAARRLRSTYCVMAHGLVLLDNFIAPDELTAIVTDHHAAGLDAVDVAVMDLADKVADDAASVTEADIDALRAHGLSDTEIFDVVAAAAARCFFSKAVDGVGAQADAVYAELEAPLREALTVGRPIAEA
jgi:uncharacterized peroxidase-related enzyme